MAKEANIIFTRYLYIKDEVRKSLFIDMILKNEEKSLFWAYELYYSGFKKELINLLWTIYYDIYYTLNPSFYKYFIQQHKAWLKHDESIEKDAIIENIISNLLRCPFNLDVFILRNIATKKCKYNYNFDELLEENNYIKWLRYCKYDISLDNSLDQAEHLNNVMNITSSKTPYTIKNGLEQFDFTMVNEIPKSTIMLSILMHMYVIKDGIEMGKKYCKTILNVEKIKQYQTLTKYDTSPLKYVCLGIEEKSYLSRKILPLAYKYCIDEKNYLSLFKLERDKVSSICPIYWGQWEYYASLSPIWLERIEKYNGKIINESKTVQFDDDDDLENFYEEYGYEPEEQLGEVQIACIQNIHNLRKWDEECIKLNKDGVVKIDNKKIKLSKVTY